MKIKKWTSILAIGFSLTSSLFASETKVILISVDGLGGKYMQIPNFKSFAPALIQLGENQGLHTYNAKTVLPPLTVPAHGSMLSGKIPAVHGVFTNNMKSGNEQIKVNTLFDILKANIKSTGKPFTTSSVVAKKKLEAIITTKTKTKIVETKNSKLSSLVDISIANKEKILVDYLFLKERSLKDLPRVTIVLPFPGFPGGLKIPIFIKPIKNIALVFANYMLLDKNYQDTIIEAVDKGADFTFIHLGDVDWAGHGRVRFTKKDGWGNIDQKQALEKVDTIVSKIADRIDDKTIVIITADHGGEGHEHGNHMLPPNKKELGEIPSLAYLRKLKRSNFKEVDWKIPMIVFGGGVRSKYKLKNNASVLDIVPTVLGLLKIKVPKELKGSNLLVSP
jgi:predicted AlkP superfamily pyrophosphatase or phosphodiesterase